MVYIWEVTHNFLKKVYVSFVVLFEASWVHVQHMHSGVHGVLKTVFDHLEWKLTGIGSSNMGAGKQNWVFAGAVSILNYTAVSVAPVHGSYSNWKFWECFPKLPKSLPKFNQLNLIAEGTDEYSMDR